MEKRYNIFKQDISNTNRELESLEYGMVDKNGAITPFWTKPNDFVDSEGFDKENVEENGEYKMTVELPIGTKLIRFGGEYGRATAPYGSSYDLLGLPWKIESIEYHEYIVIADGVNVKCVVKKGKVREMFSSPGGAVQYVHPESIKDEISAGKLKEDLSWLEK